MSNNIKEIARGVFELDHEAGAYVLDGGAVVNFDSSPPQPEETKVITVGSGSKAGKVASWGARNNLPTDREALVMNNNIMPELLLAKRNLLIGQEAILYKQSIKNGKVVKEYIEWTNAQRDFLEQNDFGRLIRLQAKDIILNAQNTMEYIPNSNDRVTSMDYITARTIRAEEIRKGVINNWYITPDWSQPKKEVVKVPNRLTNSRPTKGKYIMRWCDEFLGGPYYYMSAWYGAKNWIKLANNIPLFHLSNVGNGYVIRFHIEFPRNYFLKIPANTIFENLTQEDQEKARKDAEKRKTEFLRQFNENLKDYKNAGTSIHSTYIVDKMKGIDLPGIKITPIQVDIKDEALLKLFEKANDAQISAAGILPSLSGIATGGKLSSGSDIRNALAYYLATKTPEQRRILYAPWIYALRKNNLIDRNTRMGSLDEIITTTDKNAGGTEIK